MLLSEPFPHLIARNKLYTSPLCQRGNFTSLEVIVCMYFDYLTLAGSQHIPVTDSIALHVATICIYHLSDTRSLDDERQKLPDLI
jgi:hypothetical protein